MDNFVHQNKHEKPHQRWCEDQPLIVDWVRVLIIKNAGTKLWKEQFINTAIEEIDLYLRTMVLPPENNAEVQIRALEE
jgi:hypothetical protein